MDLNMVAGWIVLGLGFGLLILFTFQVWGMVFFKFLKHYNIHRRIFKYYRNRENFERWLEEREKGG